MANINKVKFEQFTTKTLTPGEQEVLNRIISELQQKVNEMIDKLNTL